MILLVVKLKIFGTGCPVSRFQVLAIDIRQNRGQQQVFEGITLHRISTT